MTAAASKPRAQTNSILKALRFLTITAISIGVVVYTVGVRPETLATSYHPHLPNWSVLDGLPLLLSVHIAAAVTALGVGFVIMALPKGRGPHKALGWTWVIAMAITALSSFAMLMLPGFGLSLIHALSGFVTIMLPMAVAAIRRGNVEMHRRMMTGLFMGGLLTAAVLTLLPGRLMWKVFFG